MKYIIGGMALALTLGMSATVMAAEPAKDGMSKYRDYMPEQVRDMPEKTRNSEMPMSYIYAAQSGLAKDSELFFATQLNMLMYPGIGDYKAAVLAFQKDLGEKETGKMTVGQIYQLQSRSDMQKLPAISFPRIYASHKTQVSAVVEGTMMMVDEKIAWPINHTKITCYKEQSYCEVNELSLDVPNEKSWFYSYQVMTQHPNFYEIKNWGADTIDAAIPENPKSCRTTSMNLNFKTKEFYFITRNAGGNCEVLGTTMEKLPKPRISQIVDGEKIFEEEFGKIKEMSFSVLSSGYRNQIDKVLKESK